MQLNCFTFHILLDTGDTIKIEELLLQYSKPTIDWGIRKGLGAMCQGAARAAVSTDGKQVNEHGYRAWFFHHQGVCQQGLAVSSRR